MTRTANQTSIAWMAYRRQWPLDRIPAEDVHRPVIITVAGVADVQADPALVAGKVDAAST